MKRRITGAVALTLCSGVLWGQEAAPARKMSVVEIEEFLRSAKVLEKKSVGMGITNSGRARLSDGQFVHDAHVQTIDVSKSEHDTGRGKEMNFRDQWRYNVAAYRLDRLLGLNMVPPSVERKERGATGAYTWWVDDVLMDEVTRRKRKLEPPDAEQWNRQMYAVRVFDQLIYNTDRNLQNLVVDKDWRLWMIDHTRAFRLGKKVAAPANLVRCDRQLLESLGRLDRPTLQKEMTGYLTEMEIDGLLARRDQIVRFFTEECAKKGDSTVLYDMARR